MMANAESPGTAFDIIIERFTDEELEKTTFCFDNGCKLYEYFMNRDAEKALKTRFVIDKFHGMKGHNRCSDGFQNNKYISPKMTSNTSAAEQANSRMSTFKKNLIHSNIPNYMRKMQIRCAIANHNAQKKGK